MNRMIIAPKGTKDVLPDEVHKWVFIENAVRNITRCFGYKEIRTPVFEHTEVFERGVGNETDIVQKEMYTFNDKAGRSITLKPEGTAGVVRAYIEKGLYSLIQPIKMYYLTPVFRYEAPQSGRLREHHQFGIEVFGSHNATIDAEVINLAAALFHKLEIRGLTLNINSIGCDKCRPHYHKGLKDYLIDYKSDLCNLCVQRFDRNPMRVLDCKENVCSDIAGNAPKILGYICDECKEHFDQLQKLLDATGNDYKINDKIVRGLDYYTKTVFEFTSSDLGSQATVCGGGRYDNLVSMCGGPPTAGVGFGLGLERLIMILDNQNKSIPKTDECFVFMVILNDRFRLQMFNLMNELRKKGIPSDIDHVGRGLKAQFKLANKLNAHWVCIMGEDEHEKQQVKLKNMNDGKEIFVDITQLINYIENLYSSYSGGKFDA